MIQHFLPALHAAYTTVADEYGEQIEQYAAGRSINVAISLMNNMDNNTNNVLTRTATHVGITQAKGFHSNDKLTIDEHTYYVQYAVEGGRYTRIFLTAEEVIND